jgi:nucleoside-diphosphate-sugar epimerase
VVVDVSRARSLGWVPSISLTEGMSTAWAGLALTAPR